MSNKEADNLRWYGNLYLYAGMILSVLGLVFWNTDQLLFSYILYLFHRDKELTRSIYLIVDMLEEEDKKKGI